MVVEKKHEKQEKEHESKKAAAPPSGEHPKEAKHEKESAKKPIEEKADKARSHEAGKPSEEKGSEAVSKEEGEKLPKHAAKKEVKVKAVPLPQTVFVTGKRKRAIARASFKPGKGVIKINSVPIDLVMPDMFRLKMMEPLMIIGEGWRKFDAKITVQGGGPSGQADAVRQVIARGLSELLGPEARKAFLSYDRNLIVYDPRRTETHKPPHSSWGPRRYKQRSKR